MANPDTQLEISVSRKDTELSSQDPKPSGTTISLPIDVVHDILLRLPVKSLLRFRAVCNDWRALIYNSLFVTGYLEKSIANPFARSSLLMVLQEEIPDSTSSECHFHSAPLSGGRTTSLLKLSGNLPDECQVQHIKGLILYHQENGYTEHNFACIVNPISRSTLMETPLIFTTEHSPGNVHICNFFGFDPSCNDFKVLSIRLVGLVSEPKNIIIQCGVFSLQTDSWKMVEPTFPFDILSDDWLETFDDWSEEDWAGGDKESVCLDGVIHIMLRKSYRIVTFDLKEDKFSIIKIPAAAVPSKASTDYMDWHFTKCNYPYLLNWNGSLAVVCHEHVVYERIIELWILKDDENHSWVMETITLPCSWSDFGECFPVDFIVTGEIMFSPRRVSRECLKVTFYRIESRTFRSVEIHLPAELFASKSVSSTLICQGYVETICPLQDN